MRPIASIDSHYSQHPKRYSRTTEIVIKSGVYTYFLPEDNFIADKDIIGFSTRRQTSGTATRKTKTGREIVADGVLNAAFITFSNGNISTLDSYPLENAVLDTKVTGPGQYDQLRLPPGIKTSACKIEIPPGTSLTADTAIEITLFFLYDDNC